MDRTTNRGGRRLGMHYYPDTLHYRQSDIETWLPELEALGCEWLTLVAPPDRAIPEEFLRAVIQAGMEPLLHFPLSLASPPKVEELAPLFQSYARWGARYVALFDRPNMREQWPVTAWAHSDLVERFLDAFAPLAEEAAAAGLKPVFPPLEPGGDYWDTAFLRRALLGLAKRWRKEMLDKLTLGAYAWMNNRPVHWGAGGPERWPGAKPYRTPQGEEDHRGFRIFDWYTAISQAALGKPWPILLLAVGGNQGDASQSTVQIARLMADTPSDETIPDPVPEHVLACNFWLLAANVDSPHAGEAWYPANDAAKPVVKALKDWIASNPRAKASHQDKGGDFASVNRADKTIDCYVLLPRYEWGVSDWYLDVIRPYVKRHHATVGFSPEEAESARQVLVVGGERSFPREVVQRLRGAGCEVNQLDGDGTQIASLLEEI